MIKPYLIQRAQFTNRNRQGIDGILSFDYMGSAEFEFSALPKSLARIRKEENLYNHFEITLAAYPGKSVMILCKESDKEDLPKILSQLADRKIRLKESCDLDHYLKEDVNYQTSDFWWDIENDYFFWRSNEEFKTEFIKVLFPKNQS